MLHQIYFQFLALVLLLSPSCAKLPIDPAFAGKGFTQNADSITFAVIGDYGQDSPGEAVVSQMITSWKPDFIITTGDNNYPLGSAGTIQNNIGKYFCDYIYNPDAPADRRCQGKATAEQLNRFFPATGNHDNYSTPPLRPYLDYFTLPGDERNYEFSWGPAQFFSLNTGKFGNINDQTKDWLKDKLLHSEAKFKFVYFHHPPYSTGPHGSSTGMRLPFTEWGVDAVLCGHEHFYEKIVDKTVSNPVYIICGSSGNENLYGCSHHSLDTQRFDINCDNTHHGAMKVSITPNKAVLEYYGVDDQSHPLDVYVIQK